MAKKRRNLNLASSTTLQTKANPSNDGATPTSLPNLMDVTPNIADIDPLAENEDVNDKPRTRGPTMLKGFFKSAAKNKIKIVHNGFGQPIGDEAAKFESVCGYIARNGVLSPLTIRRWDKMPEAFKVGHLNFLKRYFIFDEKAMGIYIRKDIGKKWKDWKCEVRKKFNPDEPIEQNLKKKVDRVDPTQWTQMISLWADKDNQKISEKARERRLKQKAPHTCGRTSYARKRDRLEKDRGGDEVGDIEFFQYTHTHHDGSMDGEAAEILEKCNDIIEERDLDIEEVRKNPDLQQEIMIEVRGEERPGRVRGRGLGITPSMLSSNKKMKVEMEQMRKTYDARFEAMQKKYEAEIERNARFEAAMQKKHEAEIEKMKAMFHSFIASQQSQK